MRQSTVTGAAAVSYAANCALGTSVALRVLDTRRFRWVHHALYVATVALTAAAVSGGLWATPRRRAGSAALLLAPAMASLAAIPYLGTRTRRHPIAALTAAPFYVASLPASRR